MATPPRRPPRQPGDEDASDRLARLLAGDNVDETPPPPTAPAPLPPIARSASRAPVAARNSGFDLPPPAPEPDVFASAPQAFTNAPAPAPVARTPARRPAAPASLRQTLIPPTLTLSLCLIATAVACNTLSDDHVLGALPGYIPVLAVVAGIVLGVAAVFAILTDNA